MLSFNILLVKTYFGDKWHSFTVIQIRSLSISIPIVLFTSLSAEKWPAINSGYALFSPSLPTFLDSSFPGFNYTGPFDKQIAQRATIAHLSPMCQGQISFKKKIQTHPSFSKSYSHLSALTVSIVPVSLFFAQICQMPVHFQILTFYHVVSYILIIIFMFAITVFSTSALNKCPFSTLFAFLSSFDKPASMRCHGAGQWSCPSTISVFFMYHYKNLWCGHVLLF